MRYLISLIAVFARPVNAEEVMVAAGGQVFTTEYLLRVTGSLFLVVLLLFLALVLLRRLNTSTAHAGNGIQIISTLSVGQKERVVLLQVGDEQLLVGVSTGNVNKLHSLPKPLPQNEKLKSSSLNEVWQSLAPVVRGAK